MSMLSAENLSFSYKNKFQTVQAVKDVRFSFRQGLCYAIVGKSGSGKTTLLSLLAGLEQPTQGKVCIDGVSTGELNCDAYRRDRVAVIYQSYNLFPRLTVLENVLYPLKLKKAPKKESLEKAKRLLSSVGITEEQLRRFPAQLSGGEQQRVAIARALAGGNEIILADEPTGNLDISNSEQIMEILLSLAHEENRCVILVTHDLELASQADRVLMMRDGILEQDEPVPGEI